MTPETFVEVVKSVTSDDVVNEVIANLENPPGRKPDHRLLDKSKWYKGLALQDQEMLRAILQEAVDATAFGIFCVLDGVRAIEDGASRGELELTYKRDGETVVLNPPNFDLHDIYQSLREL